MIKHYQSIWHIFSHNKQLDEKMEQTSVTLTIPKRGSQIQHTLRYKYKFTADTLIIHVNGDDLADLLIITEKQNLRELYFTTKVEISKPNGDRADIDDVMSASPNQLRLMEAEYH